MSAIHTLKTDPAVFAAVVNGLKTFEIRFNDRGFKVGDVLTLKETTHTGAEIRAGAPLEYTGRMTARTVSHVLTGYGLAEGWCCLSFLGWNADRASRTPEPVGVPAAWQYIDPKTKQPSGWPTTSKPSDKDMPNYRPLFAATHPVVAEQQGQPEQPPSGHVALSTVEGSALKLKPMDSAPTGSLILAWCDHEAAEREQQENRPDGQHLSTYLAHCEWLSHAPDGWHVLTWCGEYEGGEDEGYCYLPNWWFVNDHDLEMPANPIGWVALPAAPATPSEAQPTTPAEPDKTNPAPLPIPLQGADEELMRQDKQRLDYLQQSGSTLELVNFNGAREFQFRVGGLRMSEHDDLRTAIDIAARLQPKGKDGQG